MRFAVALSTLILGASLLGGAANASVRSFFTPMLEGERLAFCASSGEHCGKPVADAWCRFNGYNDALLFQREVRIEPEARVLHADTGAVCTDASCLSFREIKCRSAG